MKKEVGIDKRALKDLKKAPKEVREKFLMYFQILEDIGKLEEPDAKKLKGHDLYEVRVRVRGAWRGFYAYIGRKEIHVLHIFQKKTQKTPQKEIETAISRLNN